MEGALTLLFIVGMFYLMMRHGCGAHMGRGGHHDHGGGRRKSGGAGHVDPVCGHEVAVEQGYGKMHAGRLYRFCSRKCLDAFETDPARYAEKPEIRASAAGADGT